jgi:phage gp29-like protein
MNYKTSLNAVKTFVASKVAMLSASDKADTTGARTGNVLPWDLKSTFQTRQDIKDWNWAQNLANSAEPKNYLLQLLFTNVMRDALLFSQTENRMQQIFSLDIQLKKANGDVDEAQSESFKKTPIYRFLTRRMLETTYYEYSHAELSIGSTIDGDTYLIGDIVPRTNVVPKTGLFYKDYTNDLNTIKYREMPEYGVWILEFWNKDGGLLNKAVPHVLFKRFAQSSYSELCEIYAIPPRVMKTDTQDKAMLSRAEKMMKDQGNAAYFIIDETESFDWAQGVSTSGDVYTNLMTFCDQQNCLLIVGALIGLDTKNGGRSKDESAQEMLWQLVQSDMALVEEMWNTIALPAMKRHGEVSKDITSFGFAKVEDRKQLVDWCLKFFEYAEIDLEWLKKKTGIEFTKLRETPVPSNTKGGKSLEALMLEGAKDFFDTPRRRRSA